MHDQSKLAQAIKAPKSFAFDHRTGSSAGSRRSLGSNVVGRRRFWVRRLHAFLGLISAFNLLLLIGTGFLLQQRDLLRLDERTVSRRILPAGYRTDDPGRVVRADIVVTDLHSGRLFGTTGALFLDLVTLAWLVMLATGLWMYVAGTRSGRARGFEARQDIESKQLKEF